MTRASKRLREIYQGFRDQAKSDANMLCRCWTAFGEAAKRIAELERENAKLKVALDEKHQAFDWQRVGWKLEKEKNARLREELVEHLELRINDLKLREIHGHGTRLQVDPNRVDALVGQWEKRIEELEASCSGSD